MTGRERALLWRQLAVLLDSGVPIMAALNALRSSPAAGAAVASLRTELERGRRLSEAVSQVPQFGAVDRAMLRVGESSGALVACIERLAVWQERDQEARRRTRQAMAYPAFVLAVSAALVLLLVGLVVPAFAQVLGELHAPLPVPTRMVFALAGLLNLGPLVGLAGMSVLAIHVVREWLATEAGRRQAYQAGRRIPLVGHVLASGALARYTDALHILLEAGTDLFGALELAAEVCGDPVLTEDAPHLMESIRDGESLSGYMRDHPSIYSPVLAGLIHAGEQSNRLSRFLVAAHRSFDLETELGLAMLHALMEPALVTLVALAVGAIVLSMLLPVYASLEAL